MRRAFECMACNIVKLMVVLVAVAALFPSSSAAQTAAGRISYYYCYGDEFTGLDVCKVFLATADGSKSIEIGDGYSPSLSPNGSRVAYAGYPQPGVFVLDLSDWSITQISNVSNAVEWSPDGTRFAFANGGIHVMDADGSNVVQLGNGGWAPAWSRDGGTIAFTCAVEVGNADICAINTDGTNFRRLTFDPAEDTDPAYSPDGSSIVFSTRRFSVRPKIAVMNLDGTGVTLVNEVVEGMQPAWSPDSAQIAFVRFTCDEWGYCSYDVAAMNRGGTNLHRIIPFGFEPSWSSGTRPIARFQGPDCNGFDCSFDGSLSWQGGSPIVSYAWDFGDGTHAFGVNVNHRFLEPGTYTARLTVADASGATASQSRDVYVSGDAWPIARFTYQCSARLCSFDASSSSDPDGFIVSYFWWNGETNVSGPSFTHLYSSIGPHTVTLWVTDNEGVTRSTSQTLTLSPNTLPTASFTVVCADLVCTFNASASSDAEGPITTYEWNFGDNRTATGATANHTYPWPGVFTVTLLVTDNNGETDADTRSLTLTQLVHVGDMDGHSVNDGSTWTAVVTITMHRMPGHVGASDAFVTGVWSLGGTSTCQSGPRCFVSKSGIPRRTKSVVFTINSVTGPITIYNPADNHDPDGDSNAVSITVMNP